MTTGWGQATAVWAIFAILIVLAFLWFCHKSGQDKADLAATIQNVYARLNVLEPAVAENAKLLGQTTRSLAATVQGVADIKSDVDALDNAVFTSKCGCNRNGNSSRFVAKQSYNLASSSLEQIETCGDCGCNG